MSTRKTRWIIVPFVSIFVIFLTIIKLSFVTNPKNNGNRISIVFVPCESFFDAL